MKPFAILRLAVLLDAFALAGTMLYIYILSVINNSPNVAVEMNVYGEWGVELAIFLPMLVLAPIYAWVDRERILTFLEV